jgi:hypothetical protein
LWIPDYVLATRVTMRRSLRHGLVTFIVIRQHSDTSNLAPDDRITEEVPSIQAEFHSQGSLAENAPCRCRIRSARDSGSPGTDNSQGLPTFASEMALIPVALRRRIIGSPN